MTISVRIAAYHLLIHKFVKEIYDDVSVVSKDNLSMTVSFDNFITNLNVLMYI